MLSTVPSNKFYPPLGNCVLQSFISKLIFYIVSAFSRTFDILLTNPKNAVEVSKQTAAPKKLEIKRHTADQTYIYDNRHFDEQINPSEVFNHVTKYLCDVDESLWNSRNALRHEQSKAVVGTVGTAKKCYSDRIVSAIGDLTTECQRLMSTYANAVRKVEQVKRMEEIWSNNESIDIDTDTSSNQASDGVEYRSCGTDNKASTADEAVSTMTLTVEEKRSCRTASDGRRLYELEVSGDGCKTYQTEEGKVAQLVTYYHQSKQIFDPARESLPKRVWDRNGRRQQQEKRRRPTFLKPAK